MIYFGFFHALVGNATSSKAYRHKIPNFWGLDDIQNAFFQVPCLVHGRACTLEIATVFMSHPGLGGGTCHSRAAKLGMCFELTLGWLQHLHNVPGCMQSQLVRFGPLNPAPLVQEPSLWMVQYWFLITGASTWTPLLGCDFPGWPH